MPLASGVVRVAEATGEARSPSASGENRAGSSGPEKPARRWCPWEEGRAPISWDAPGDADARWRFGARLFSADFDGGNLARVERVTDTSFHLWTRPDNQGTPHETHHRTWFHFRVDGCRAGETLTFSFPDFNKQKTLFSNDFRPTYRAHATSGSSDGGPERAPGTDGGTDGSCEKFHMRAYRHVREPVSARTGRDGAFRVSFKHRFDSEASVFFALSFPFSYGDVGAMLDRVDAKFRERTSHGDSMRAHVSYARSLLTTSVEGRKVEMVTITAADGEKPRYDDSPEASGRANDDANGLDTNGLDANGLDAIAKEPDRSSRSTDPSAPRRRVPRLEDRDVFVVTCGVHPGEKPANHLFNGALEFLLRADDARAARLRELYVFHLVPMLNPDGAFRGHYRHDTLGQNLNRHYESPDPAAQPSCAAVKALLTAAAKEERLAFYLDLHAHANKRGVFAFGNSDLAGGGDAETRAYAQLCALNSPHFDLNHCNFSRKNMASVDKNGDCKSGTGRVALFRETNGRVPHLYTVEANYNCSRLLNRVTEKSGDANDDDAAARYAREEGGSSSAVRRANPRAFHDASRAATTQRPKRKSFFEKVTKRYDPETLRGVGRALLVAALDLREENPRSRVPSSAFASVRAVRNWAKAAARGDARDGGASSDDGSEDGEGHAEPRARSASTSKTLASSKTHRRRALDTANAVWPARRALADAQPGAPKWRT